MTKIRKVGIPTGGTTGQVLKKSSNTDFEVEWGTGGSGASDFTDLSDVPSSYTGQANKVVRVNAAETALEFAPAGRYILYKNNVSVPLTGTLVEQKMDSFKIDAGTLEANDVLRFTVLTTKTGTGGTYTVRINANTTDDLIGDIQLGLVAAAANNTAYLKFEREMFFKNSLTSQVVMSTSLSLTIDLQNITNAISTPNVDFTVDQYITVSIILANTGDTATLQAWYVELIRS